MKMGKEREKGKRMGGKRKGRQINESSKGLKNAGR